MKEENDESWVVSLGCALVFMALLGLAISSCGAELINSAATRAAAVQQSIGGAENENK